MHGTCRMCHQEFGSVSWWCHAQCRDHTMWRVLEVGTG
jgi:hypothetical protein